MTYEEELRKILFKAAGGISNMADEEIAAIKAATLRHTKAEVDKARKQVIRLATERTNGTLTINNKYICEICGLVASDLGDLITTKVRSHKPNQAIQDIKDNLEGDK